MFNKIWFKFPERVSLKTLVLRTPCFGTSHPQVVRVPPVKNHWSILFTTDLDFTSKANHDSPRTTKLKNRFTSTNPTLRKRGSEALVS